MKFSGFLRIVSFAAVLLPFSVQAQFINGYGVKVGVNSSNAALSAVQSAFEFDTERRTGANAALFLEWGASSAISLVTQVEYAQRGFVEEQAVTGEDSPEPIQIVQANTRLDYISLPILLKLQYSPGPYFVLGPRVDFLVNRVAGVFEFSIGNFESPLSQGFDDRALGGTIGLGFSADKLLRLPLPIETRYNFDFTNSADNQTLGQAKINSFDVWLGIKL
jgi:hypothetical protein